MLSCWHLVWILVRTNHPYLGVGCHSCTIWRSPVIAGHPQRSTQASTKAKVAMPCIVATHDHVARVAFTLDQGRGCIDMVLPPPSVALPSQEFHTAS
jgi:hypothetical protein